MAKPDSNFVYYITKKGDGMNCVRNLRKSTHVQEEGGSIVNEYNVLFDN